MTQGAPFLPLRPEQDYHDVLLPRLRRLLTYIKNRFRKLKARSMRPNRATSRSRTAPVST